MKHLLFTTVLALGFCFNSLNAQDKNPVIESIIKEANENSQLEALAHEMLDVVGPRLVGTPQMQEAHDWAVAKYKSWGVTARNEK